MCYSFLIWYPILQTKIECHQPHVTLKKKKKTHGHKFVNWHYSTNIWIKHKSQSNQCILGSFQNVCLELERQLRRQVLASEAQQPESDPLNPDYNSPVWECGN